MDSNPTHCKTCDGLDPRTRKLDGWRWRCRFLPVEDIPHHLGPGIRATHPLGRCLDRNKGNCPDWTPLRGAYETFEMEMDRG